MSIFSFITAGYWQKQNYFPSAERLFSLCNNSTQFSLLYKIPQVNLIKCGVFSCGAFSCGVFSCGVLSWPLSSRQLPVKSIGQLPIGREHNQRYSFFSLLHTLGTSLLHQFLRLKLWSNAKKFLPFVKKTHRRQIYYIIFSVSTCCSFAG